MKSIIITIIFLFSSILNAQFLHPMDFNGGELQKKEVIEYIKVKVNKDYCETVDMCQAVMLRLMEEENLNAFKRLTLAKDRVILDRVIKNYCGKIDMCNYAMLELMYNENLKASQKSLEW